MHGICLSSGTWFCKQFTLRDPGEITRRKKETSGGIDKSASRMYGMSRTGGPVPEKQEDMMKRSLGIVAAIGLSAGSLLAGDMEKACAFLKDAGYYFIATDDGGQPRVRPFGTALIYNGKLYLQTARKKNVYKQIVKNPKVELCAYKPKEGCWLRLTGSLVEDPSVEAEKAMLDAYPSLKKLYQAGDGNNVVLYFKSATGTINSFGAPQVDLKF